jgi:lysophospholipase L1-like esterase
MVREVTGRGRSVFATAQRHEEAFRMQIQEPGQGRPQPSSRPPRLTTAAKAALLAGASLAGTVLVLGLFELTATLILSRRSVTPVSREGEIAGDPVSRTIANLDLNPAPLIPDPDLLWRNAPDVDVVRSIDPRPWGTQPTWRIVTGREGYRSGDVAPKASGRLRILCEGDSVTYGFNVDQDDTYPAHLAEELRDVIPGRPVDVVNAGVPGWSWIQGLKFVENEGLALQPDVVVMAHGPNDQIWQAKVTDEERLRMLGGPLRRPLHRAMQVLSRTNLHALLGPAPVGGVEAESPGCAVQRRQYGYCRRVSLEQIAESVREAARVVGGAGAQLVVLNMDFLRTGAAQAARAAAAAVGVPFVDAVAALDREKAGHDVEVARGLGLAPPIDPDAAADPAARTVRVVFRLKVPEVSEPAPAWRVRGTGLYVDSFAFDSLLHDDGQDGDERAGDGVWSWAQEVPSFLPYLDYQYFRGSEPESRPLPPLESTMSGRVQRVGAGGWAPVDDFGPSWFMAEKVHPNARGQRAIAGLVADRLQELPSFQRFVGSSASPAANGDRK